MKKKLLIQLIAGLALLLTGITMTALHVVPPILPVTLAGMGGGLLITWFFLRKNLRGDVVVYDEMMRRIDALSGFYMSTMTLYFVMLLAVVNYFRPLPMTIGGVLLIILLFMSITFIVLRFVLWRRGKTE